MTERDTGYLTRLKTDQDRNLKDQVQQDYDEAVHPDEVQRRKDDNPDPIDVADIPLPDDDSTGSEEDVNLLGDVMAVTEDQMRALFAEERKKKKDKIEPQEFLGLTHENPESWLRKFEAYTDIHQVDDKEKKLTFSFLLRGVADIWYSTWLSEKETDEAWKAKTDAEKWKDIKDAFKEKFAKNEYVNIQKLENVKMSDFKNAEGYLNHLERMGHVTGTKQKALIPYILRGLPDDMRELVASQESKTLDECMKRVYLIESLVKQRKSKAEVKAAEGTDDRKLKVLTEAVLQMSEKLGKLSAAEATEGTRDGRSRDFRRGDTYVRRRDPIRCYNCEKLGHMSRDCWSRRRSGGGRNGNGNRGNFRRNNRGGNRNGYRGNGNRNNNGNNNGNRARNDDPPRNRNERRNEREERRERDDTDDDDQQEN